MRIMFALDTLLLIASVALMWRAVWQGDWTQAIFWALMMESVKRWPLHEVRWTSRSIG
jgi:hypothetical protein